MTESEFRWGTTTSSVQTEGAHPAADWSRWETAKRAPESADGNGFATNFHDDLALIASLGVTDIRITTEWARIEPTEGKTDSEAIDRYRDIVAHARSVGLEPWVTLVSTSLPGWFSDDGGGFGDERARNYHFMRHVDRCAEHFGEHAAGFTPIDDPVGWAIRGYHLGSRPPGRTSAGNAQTLYDQITGALQADHQAARFLRTGPGQTMAVRGTPTIFAAVDDAASPDEADAARSRVNWWAALLFDSWIDMIATGELVLPDATPLHDLEWQHDFDVIGLNYDNPIGINHQGQFRRYPADAPAADTGFAPLPEELGVLLQRVAERTGDRPLTVAGHGVATTNDGWRTELLEQTLDVVEQSVADGVPLVGFFHDTAIDGYEWRAGFNTERGVIARDRTIKPSGHYYSERIAASGV